MVKKTVSIKDYADKGRKPSYFVFFRQKNIFLATLSIPCTPLGGKVKKYGGKIKKYKAKLKGLGQSYIVSKTAIR